MGHIVHTKNVHTYLYVINIITRCESKQVQVPSATNLGTPKKRFKERQFKSATQRL